MNQCKLGILVASIMDAMGMANTAQAFQFETHPGRALGWDRPALCSAMSRAQGQHENSRDSKRPSEHGNIRIADIAHLHKLNDRFIQAAIFLLSGDVTVTTGVAVYGACCQGTGGIAVNVYCNFPVEKAVARQAANSV